MKIAVTAEEAWTVYQYVRQHDQLGREHDKEQAQRVHAALLYFKANPASTYDLELDTEMGWWITRQVPWMAQIGTQNVGKAILLKVMEALAETPDEMTEATEEPTTEVGEPYRASFQRDDDALVEFNRLYGEVES